MLRTVPVARAMSAAAPTARQDLLVSEAATLLDLDGTRALIVLDEGGSLDAIATVQDVESALLQGKPGLTIAEIASRTGGDGLCRRIAERCCTQDGRP